MSGLSLVRLVMPMVSSPISRAAAAASMATGVRPLAETTSSAIALLAGV